jgi:signal transduction histidine kinase
MIVDILSVAEIEAGAMKLKKDDVRLEELFHELQADYAAQAEDKGIELTFNLPPKLPVIQADRNKVSLGLHNLLGNAMKYTPSGGKVSVNVALEPTRLVVDVVDTGIGISSEDRQRIFEKFYRAQDRRVTEITGSGLGLAIAREVVRMHGGDISVESELNKGSTFTLVLPLAKEAA